MNPSEREKPVDDIPANEQAGVKGRVEPTRVNAESVKTQVELLLNRRTRIIATVGPACSDKASIERLIRTGVNVFRLNMSHGDHRTHRDAYNHIRDVAAELQIAVAILADLCGPKIRTGVFPGGVMSLQTGQTVTISTTAEQGGQGVIVSQYKALATDVREGDQILLADGLFELKVLSLNGSDVMCEVIQGGALGNNKGMNLPGVAVSAPSLTEKDVIDAKFAIDLGVDFLALSFVRTADDIHSLRSLISEAGGDCRIIAKIEKPEALFNAESILAATDVIMIARGDLGVELPPEQVPSAQVQLVRLCHAEGVPVIVATQMLESMMTNPRPTRAEVTDVAYAVESGVDAVMLSGETAAGEHPFAAVDMMNRICRQTESQLWKDGHYGLLKTAAEPPLPLWTVIATSTARMSRDLMARAVMVVTRSGKSAETVATARPASPIVAITADPRVYQRLSLYWGVIPILDPAVGSTHPNDLARSLAVELGLASQGQYILLVRGFHGEHDKNLPSVTAIQI